eukprot:CAMPEP_0179962238 /NCGR_PEP_ID=MMETSP0983-20121128/30124_1 /TAXON_ID=483367 /ORGANISM="non described non described, Strain CCMP 2436" /LENGTH=65 /DNA_ID=CAMNT_0021874755 /DNA_START=396 /DNA_END=589 /DNA_ORIENTATION=+
MSTAAPTSRLGAKVLARSPSRPSGAQFDNTPGDVRHIDAPSTRPLYALAPAFKPAMGVLVKVVEG